MRLLIFNPWNDLALANGDPNFCIPASSVKMAHDLAPIQSLWSEPGDIIFNPQRGLSCDEADKVQEVIPWGWSPLLKKLLLDRKSTRLNSSHRSLSRMPSSARITQHQRYSF